MTVRFWVRYVGALALIVVLGMTMGALGIAPWLALPVGVVLGLPALRWARATPPEDGNGQAPQTR